MHRSQKIKILVCSESNCGGETIATYNITQELSKLGYVVTPVDYPPLVHTDFLRFFLWVALSISHWIKVVLKNRDTDYMYTTTYTAGIASIATSIFRTHKLIWHFHGSRIPPHAKGLTGFRYITQFCKFYLVYYLHLFLIWKSSLIFVPSTTGKRFLEKHFKWINQEKIRIIPNGVDLKKFYPNTNDQQYRLRKNYMVERNNKLILFVGRLNIHKGIMELLKSINIMIKTLNNIRLIIVHPRIKDVSEVKYKHLLQLYIKSHHLDKNVLWFEEPERVEEIYRIADLVVSLSKIEYFPLSLLEALASGKPYVSHAERGTKGILTHLNKNLILETENIKSISKQLFQILNMSTAKKRALSEKCRNMASLYSWQKTGELLHKELRSL